MNKQKLKQLIPNELWMTYYLRRVLKNDPLQIDAIQPNIELKDRYKGERCFIFGNGPSLKTLDFSPFAYEYTFTVNQITKNPQFAKLKTNFHVWQDERIFLEENFQSPEFVNTLNDVETADNKPFVFYRASLKRLIDKYNITSSLNKYYFLPIKPKVYNLNNHIDYSKIVYDYPTVVQTCICLAVYMGFSEIYLLGCDCTGIVSIAEAKAKCAENSLYAYDISESEKKRMEKQAGMSSFRDEMASQVEILDLYALLNSYCKRKGVKLFNTTQGGLLETLPRVSLDELFH